MTGSSSPPHVPANQTAAQAAARTAGVFDPSPARSGLAHIDLAFTRWSEFLDLHPPRPMSSSVATTQFLHANSYVVDLVRWIRAVDDYLQGRDSGPGASIGLPSYVTARADPAMTGPLDALRYAANKSLHLLRPRHRPSGVHKGH